MSHNSPDIQLLIRSHINAFTKTEAKVANFVLNNLEKVIYLSVTELAEKAGVGETTVLRFCRKLDYKGFQERSEERRVGKRVDGGGGRGSKKKKQRHKR